MQPANPIRVSNGRDSGCAAPSLSIDIFFDFICPWCLIGSRHLSAALARFAELRADVHVDVRWRSCQLLPYTPREGIDYQSFYVARLGSPENVAIRREQVRNAGMAAGVEFRFERIELLPNTKAAHELIAYAGRLGEAALQAGLIESLFTAYFVDGEDIGDVSVLERRAVEFGLERRGVRDYLAASDERVFPQPDGISGVPLFLFGESVALSGASSPDALLDALLRVAPAATFDTLDPIGQ